ncbi:hypothetical protein HPP92_014263 [Vanilla planifolia]|uniref:Uncharacterized protein n=1 Tax=Vanilla planifolia TaxID=51239 RepID=A0A835QZB7_VANPL|nr:hypothetical protein HPP92_014263 [Vanilla planifolia]
MAGRRNKRGRQYAGDKTCLRCAVASEGGAYRAQENVIFMNSRSTVAPTVSCTSGNNKSFGVSICLLPGFLGTPIVRVNFQLFKAIVRDPSSSLNVDIFGVCLP